MCGSERLHVKAMTQLDFEADNKCEERKCGQNKGKTKPNTKTHTFSVDSHRLALFSHSGA